MAEPSPVPIHLRATRRRFGTRLVETAIMVVALSVLVLVALLFLFVGREAAPIAFGRLNSALLQEVIPVDDALRLPTVALQQYLDLTPSEFARLDTHALRELASLKVEARQRIPPAFLDDPDARLNTVAWRHLLLPHRWTGYDQPVHVWQPVSLIHKYNIVPLLAGSFKVAWIALLVATPLALGAALFVSQLAPPRWRAWIKPAIELIAGLPSIVLAFLALVLLASLLETPARAVADLLQIPVSRLNALVAGLAVGFAIVPLIFTLADDALSAVPRNQVHSALALGATRWQAALHIVTPAAAPGLLAAVTLGFGRALGETMIVLLASGNAALLSWNLLQPTRTIAATIAAEMAEAVFGGHHYRMLFLIGTLLFAVTFSVNLAADLIRHRLRQRLAGLS